MHFDIWKPSTRRLRPVAAHHEPSTHEPVAEAQFEALGLEELGHGAVARHADTSPGRCGDGEHQRPRA